MRETKQGYLFDEGEEGRRLRDEGVAKVEDSNDAAQEWREQARGWVISRAGREGQFNADDLRAAIGPPPNLHNAMGAVFLWHDGRVSSHESATVPCGERKHMPARHSSTRVV